MKHNTFIVQMKLICIMMTASKMTTKRETQGYLCLNKKIWILLIKLKLFAVQYACNVTDNISFLKKLYQWFFSMPYTAIVIQKVARIFFDFLLKTSFFINKNLVRYINWLCEMIIGKNEGHVLIVLVVIEKTQH